jgi:hypothetical protein
MALVWAYVWEERVASIISVERISDQLVVIANVILSSTIVFTVKMEAKLSAETLVHTRVALLLIPEDDVLHSPSSFVDESRIAERRTDKLLCRRLWFPLWFQRSLFRL